MNFFTAVLIGVKEIWAHKFRSLLTMLGIVLGVSSLITMMAIVKGMENGMKEAMIAMGGLDKIRITDSDLPVHQEHLRYEAMGNRIQDVHALRASAPLLRLVSPEMEVGRVSITRAGKTHRPSEVVGVWPAVLDMNLYEVEHGRFFTDIDEANANAVCVIGTGIRDEMFGSVEETGREIIPLGEEIRINDQLFTIVGMFKHYESEQDRIAREQAKVGENTESGPPRRRGFRSRNWDAFWRKNNVVYMPLNTAWIRFRAASGAGGIPDPKLSDIDIKVADVAQLEAALQQAQNVLMHTHNGIEDFSFSTQENNVDDINKRIRNARLSGGIIAALSLLVGGIGIMNIMLASINERIREIGTCKALGATGSTVFLQILVESMVLAMIGALAGLVAAYVLVDLVAFFSVAQASPGYTRESSQSPPQITYEALLLGIASSAVVGVLAGFLPAAKAAQLNPIEALRYE